MRQLALTLLVVTGCDFSSESTSRDLGGSLTVRGHIVDYKSGDPVVGATLEISGLTADVTPTIEITDSMFEIQGVIENSTFQIRASAASYRPTFGPSVVVVDADVTDVRVPVVPVTYLESLVAGFQITPPTMGTLLARLVKNGTPVAGIGTNAFAMPGGPYFLDASLEAVRGGQVTSASGAVAFFDVPAGVTGIAQPTAPPVALDMPVSPIEAGSVTLADIAVLDGQIALPVDVKFSTTIYPIFARRGCAPCHSGGGEGKNLGNLTLDGAQKKVYDELLVGLRVNKAMPELSRVLTYPSRESPADPHPNITFASNKDPDYLALLVWIREGARDN